MASLMMSIVEISILCGVFALGSADKVPVLIWSQSRPLSDLPQAYAGNSIDGKTFLHQYLSPLTQKAGHNVVAFLQDKLHMEDFTKYADVYNPFSDGGAFKNIKNLMDEHFSVNLPSVHSPKSVIDTLMKEFNGRVHKVSSPEHVSGLKMEENKSYLILVTLPATSQKKNEEQALAKNDAKVGKIVKALNKRSIEYTALFTGVQSERSAKSAFKGRHLLATAENMTGIFANVSGQMFFYSRNIEVVLVERVKTSDDDEGTKVYTPISFPTEEGTYFYNNSVWDNKTAKFVLETDQAVANVSGMLLTYNVTFQFTAAKKSDRWIGANFSLSIQNDTGVLVEDLAISLGNAYMALPPLFSYHCSNLTLYPYNMTKQQMRYAVIRFDGLQFQPYGINKDQFGDPWDCVGFFTTPIWMGLVPVGIFTVILFFGMYMITQLTTMDRFDDPKGKTITVNVNE